jgi:OOP family OmpA-OmpF porin
MIKRTAMVLGTCLSLTSAGVFAGPVIAVEGDVESSGDGYVNADGLVFKTGLGECLQTGTLNDDNIINKCAGIEDEVAAEVEEEAAEEEVAAVEPEPPAAPEQTATIDTRDFSEVALFDVDSAALNSDGQTMMSGLFDALSEFKGITAISVTGHTDSTGPESYNQTLSEQRAATVASEIATEYPGVRMDVQGLGETSPIASNDTAEGRQQNRRVEIEITATRMVFN